MPAAAAVAVAVAADSSAVVALGNYLVVPVVLDDCLVVPVVLDDCFLAQDVYCFSVVLQPQLRLARPITMTTTQRQPRLARSERVDD